MSDRLNNTLAQQCREYILGLEGATACNMAGGAPGEPWVIENVKLLGVESVKGRRYTKAALESAVSLYEGKPIYANHADVQEGMPPGAFKSRDVEESLGFVRNVKHRPGQGLFGDACFTVKDRLTESVMIAAGPKGNPKQYGFSPHHYYDGKRAADGMFDVTEIVAVESVDLVTKPATTGGLYEGVDIVSKPATVTPTDTNKLAVTGQGGTPVTGTPTATPPAKKTHRQALEGVTRFKWEREVVAALPKYADGSPSAATEGLGMEVSQPSTDDQITMAFRGIIMGILDDNSLSDDEIVTKIDEVLAAKRSLVEGEKPEKKKDKDEGGSSGEEGQQTITPPATGIGALEAQRLFDRHKVASSTEALEAIQTIPAPAAEYVTKRFADYESQLAKMKDLLPNPQSLPRGAWIGRTTAQAGTEGQGTSAAGGNVIGGSGNSGTPRKVPKFASVN